MIKDTAGNTEYVSFSIFIDSGLKLEEENEEKIYKKVKLGGNTDLVVKTSASEPLSYSWYHLEENSYKRMEETTETLHLTDVCKREEYVCVVADSCGNSQRINFTVRIDTGLKMDYEKMKTISFVKPGESDSFTISDIKTSAAYVGYAHDAYDGEEVTFYIEIPDYENAVKLTENEKKRAETYDSLTFKYFKIEAEKEGKYTIFSENDADVEVYLLDAEGNLAAQSKGNAAIEMQKEIKKGEVYYLAVKPEGYSICRVGFKVEEKHTHKWSKWSVTKAATYTKKGVETRKCEGCGKKETREIKCKTIPTPKLVSAKATGSSKITVTWKAVSGKVKVTWKKLSNVDGYQVCRKTKNGSWKVIGTVSSKTTSYMDKTAKKGVTYYYTVKAYNDNKGSKVIGFYDTKGKSVKAK